MQIFGICLGLCLNIQVALFHKSVWHAKEFRIHFKVILSE